jgi:hypothetical protein
MVNIYPEVGGKLGQILDKISGQQIFVSPQKDYQTIPVDGDWLEYDTSGMDDCFPNVAAGVYPGLSCAELYLPDLGEWTHGAWQTSKIASKEITMEFTGHTLPYFAVKTVRFVDEQTLELSYSVENRGQQPIRYLWSAHPLISVPAEFDLQMYGNLVFRVFPADNAVHSWPRFKGTDLSSEWISPGATLKVFVTGLTEGICALRLPMHTLVFTFDLDVIPAVGIWFNNFGFPLKGRQPFRCIAIEPCTSPSDLLDDLEAAAYPIIAVAETARWAMRLRIAPRI